MSGRVASDCHVMLGEDSGAVFKGSSHLGGHRTAATCACCQAQRDVPGITRSVVPVLAGMGIKALTMGVNGGSAPPAIPHNTPFRWRDERSGSELLVMQHPGERARCLFWRRRRACLQHAHMRRHQPCGILSSFHLRRQRSMLEAMWPGSLLLT